MITQYLTRIITTQKGFFVAKAIATAALLLLLGVPVQHVVGDPGEQGTWG